MEQGGANVTVGNDHTRLKSSIEGVNRHAGLVQPGDAASSPSVRLSVVRPPVLAAVASQHNNVRRGNIERCMCTDAALTYMPANLDQGGYDLPGVALFVCLSFCLS